jgi:hypothetical protein
MPPLRVISVSPLRPVGMREKVLRKSYVTETAKVYRPHPNDGIWDFQNQNVQ